MSVALAVYMIKVHCDTGGYRPELKRMQQQAIITLVQFHYENRNKNAKKSAPPSKPTWDEMNYSWDELHNTTWNDLGKTSDQHSQIITIIGINNKRDIKHLDSAYMAGCKAFISSDKDDICSKRKQIYQLLGIHPDSVTSSLVLA